MLLLSFTFLASFCLFSQIHALPSNSLDRLHALSCTVEPGHRSDCGYLGVSREDCERQGCCWDPVHQLNGIPWCFHRQAQTCHGYSATDIQETPEGLQATLNLKGGCRVYGPDVPQLTLTIDYETDTRVHIKITDAKQARFEVPVSLFPRPQRTPETNRDSATYNVVIDRENFSIKVIRKADGEAIFDTSSPGGGSLVNPLVFEDQYLEISTRLPRNAHIFGLGEVVHALRRDPSNTRQTMWARDSPTPIDQNVYGTHPFHMELRQGRAHGVFLLNSNGMDILLRDEILTYKVIGGVLDFYIFSGPTPSDVVHQYYEVIGYPHMIPYWVLGFHHCRYGYKNLQEVKEVVRRYKEARIPLETMWTDIDYMEEYKDFTLDEHNFPEREMQEFVHRLHEDKQHYVLIIDPAIKAQPGYKVYDEALKEDLFIKNADGTVLVGKVWPGLTAFPDFLHPKTQQWWTKWIREFKKMVPIDGLWIDMNEPASFCDGHCYPGLEQEVHELIFQDGNKDLGSIKESSSTGGFDPLNPAYKINNAGWEAPLALKTVSPDALHYNNTLHYNVHNLYGHMEAIATRNALIDIDPEKRPFILTRSSFPGSGVYSGHWTGDNWSSWEHLYLSIPSMLSFQLFGIPLVGADICGFINDATEELCARWMQLGAFYPFSRNHNTINARPQEPYLWPSVTQASRNALAVRYNILPFYYTLFYQSHKFGATVVRPLFFEFPEDPKTPFYDRQFLIGPSILITPVLNENAREVSGYFPSAIWYDWYTHRLTANVSSTPKQGEWRQLAAPLDHINIHIRGGYIIPTQKPAMTTFEARKNNFRLKVALNEKQMASGDLYQDDGESLPIQDGKTSYIHFSFAPTAKGFQLSAEGVFKYKPQGVLEDVYVLGLQWAPSRILVNSRVLDKKHWSYDSVYGELVLHEVQEPLTRNFVISML